MFQRPDGERVSVQMFGYCGSNDCGSNGTCDILIILVQVFYESSCHNLFWLLACSLYKCPQCQISLIDMHQYWERMDTEREAWIMPQQLREFKVKVAR